MSDSDDDLFGGAASWMEEAEEEGTVDVDVARKDSSDVDRSGHENWVFKEQSYWEERFKTEEKYDWLTGFVGIEALLNKHLARADRVLVVGCGNSTLSRDMYDAGFVHLTNLDFSASVIERMAEQHGASCPEMSWEVGDMMDMKAYADGAFDVVLDKAAMDALLVDEGDVWNPREECLRDADRALSEFSRVLRPGGKLLQVTFAQPHFRRKYLDKDAYGWAMLPEEKVDEGLGYFFYPVLKHGGPGSDAAAPEPEPEPEPAPAVGGARPAGISVVGGFATHDRGCTCGLPPTPSLFEMAALRKEARQAKEAAAAAAAEPPG